ncbi:MAG TPA: hypothetical protein VIO38_01595, partial [Rariglobus sp.]
MSRSFSLGIKIAAAVSVFALGYAVSITLGTIRDLGQEKELDLLAKEAVPGALEIREARFVFDAAAQSHQDAMITGDADELATVKRLAGRTSELLKVTEAHHTELHIDLGPVHGAQQSLQSFAEESPLVFAAVAAKG